MPPRKSGRATRRRSIRNRMPVVVEVSLRLPNVRVRSEDQPPDHRAIDHAAVRFRKRVELPALPAPGDKLELATRSGNLIPCEVVRSDWSEREELFVLACRYVGRGMSAELRDAITNDEDWS